ncbi:MAG: S1C family serine protease [Treponemataceae bacterium]|nr:S1C family serine protease [Treponemataceae bacterium]
MTKRIHSLLFVAFLISFILSCRTFSGTPQVKPDYTDEEIRISEVENIRKTIQDYPVKALWLSSLLQEKAPDEESVKNLFQDCSQAVKELLEKSVSEELWYKAKNLSDTLLCVCGSDSVTVDIQQSIDKGLADLTAPLIHKTSFYINSDDSSDSERLFKASDFIKGTVTVWVDRGVTVQHRVGYSDVALGSGFFIDKTGYIITNYHVIQSEVDPKYEGYSRLYIKLAGKPEDRIPAKVIGWDSSVDLALIKADIKPSFVFSLGSASDLDVGDNIIAVGSPLGLEHTVTSGIISAVDRDVGMSEKVIQIDAAVNSGNSGGPVVDAEGKVQGVVFAGLAEYQGLNFVIPVEVLKSDLSALASGGEVCHPWIGIAGRTKKIYPSDEEGIGVEVFYLLPAGIADYAGIVPGDIISSFDGLPVKNMDELHDRMIPAGIDRIVEVGLLSGPEHSEYRSVKIYLDKRPEYPGLTIYRNDLLPDALYPLAGMELLKVSPSKGNNYVVKSVVKGSVADESGFSDGDPVEIISAEPVEENSYLYVELYAKKRRKGYLDVNLGFALPLDSRSFF